MAGVRYIENRFLNGFKRMRCRIIHIFVIDLFVFRRMLIYACQLLTPMAITESVFETIFIFLFDYWESIIDCVKCLNSAIMMHRVLQFITWTGDASNLVGIFIEVLVTLKLSSDFIFHCASFVFHVYYQRGI